MTGNPPDALLFITPGCPHCPAVLQGLADLVKQGKVGALEVVNVAVHPGRAAALGVRSAPWCRIGPFVLEGTQSPATLRRWADHATSGTGGSDYLREQLASGRLALAERYVEPRPEALTELLPRLADRATPMQARIGASAIIEDHARDGGLRPIVPALIELSRNDDHRARGDACHLLGVAGIIDAVPALRERLADSSAEVREIATESLELLGISTGR